MCMGIIFYKSLILNGLRRGAGRARNSLILSDLRFCNKTKKTQGLSPEPCYLGLFDLLFD